MSVNRHVCLYLSHHSRWWYLMSMWKWTRMSPAPAVWNELFTGNDVKASSSLRGRELRRLPAAPALPSFLSNLLNPRTIELSRELLLLPVITLPGPLSTLGWIDPVTLGKLCPSLGLSCLTCKARVTKSSSEDVEMSRDHASCTARCIGVVYLRQSELVSVHQSKAGEELSQSCGCVVFLLHCLLWLCMKWVGLWSGSEVWLYVWHALWVLLHRCKKADTVLCSPSHWFAF